MKLEMKKANRMSEQCVARGVRRLERSVTQLYDEILRPSGLRATQLSLLTAIRQQQPVPVKKLAGGMGMDRTTLTRNLSVLERDGLIKIKPTAADRRSKAIELTAKGNRRWVEAYPHWEKAQQRLGEILGRAHKQELIMGVSTAADAIRAENE